MSLGAPELIIILVIVLLLFGTTRLPKLAKSLGEASREFKKGTEERDREEAARAAQSAAPVAPTPPPAPAPPAPPAPSVATSDPNEQVTMSRAELDALLAERERTASKDVPPPAQG
ncbi:MAG TPA: twin-arginine translocase TatA/TatE family subunit [Acidimicrobiales bacterium]|jgi:sec-independent protein translocase protein TatA|nr:twin-arginine translocase TatA/TatE family subunit [Acidimicrobiales bacterium]